MPIITKIGGNRGKDGRERAAVTWVDIDVADPQGRAWLSAWQAIGAPPGPSFWSRCGSVIASTWGMAYS